MSSDTSFPAFGAQGDGVAASTLVVDVDGTLFRTDLLYECVAALLRRPWLLLLAPYWLTVGGKAGLKRRLAELALGDALAALGETAAARAAWRRAQAIDPSSAARLRLQ